MEHVITGQAVSRELRDRARKLRREMTETERLLWAELRDHRLQNRHFRRQQVIGGYIADFYCNAARLVIEIDGKVHDRQEGYDAERDRIIVAYGITILRVTNDEVSSDLAAILGRITERLSPHPRPRAAH